MHTKTSVQRWLNQHRMLVVGPAVPVGYRLCGCCVGGVRVLKPPNPCGSRPDRADSAVVAWQYVEPDRPRRLALAGITCYLVLALLTHYYAVLLCLPILGGEVVRAVQRRKVFFAPLIAVAAALLRCMDNFLEGVHGFQRTSMVHLGLYDVGTASLSR